MSESKFLLVQPALDHAQSLAGLERLKKLAEVDGQKIIVTHEKLDTEKKAKTFSIHADHSTIPNALATMAIRAGRKPMGDAAYACALNLWALSQIVARFGEGHDWAILLGEGAFDAAKLPGPRKKKSQACWSVGPHLAVDLENPQAREQLTLAVEMALDGAAYALGGSPQALLDAAGEALSLYRDHEVPPLQDEAPEGEQEPDPAEREAEDDAEAKGNDIDADGDEDEGEVGQ